MTRINTNVSSLVAQQRLQRSNNDLNLALQRLSTGLRINNGKDDPAGLIASEGLRSDITSVNSAITNTQRANTVIATADSALGQVSNLLNDIRGLATQAANSGALSAEQIAANQLQVDSSLEAINRISATTSFQGRKLLDGSLDFITSGGSNFDKLSNLGVQQANLGTAGSLAVAVDVSAAATQAQVDLTNIPAATAAVNAANSFAFTHTQTNATSGTITLTNGTIDISAVNGEFYQGSAGNLNVSIIEDGTLGSAATAAVAGGTLTIKFKDAATTINDVKAAVEAINDGGTAAGDFSVAVTNGAGTLDTAAAPVGDDGITGALTGGTNTGSATVRVVSDTAGAAANAVNVSFAQDNSLVVNTATATLSGGNILVKYRGTVSYSAITTAINNLAGYTASITASSGSTNHVAGTDADPGAANLAGGADASGGLSQDAVFELAGLNGSQIFSFQAGTSINQLKTAIDALSDDRVSSSISGTTLQLKSSAYGSDAFVNIRVVSEGAGGTITTAIGTDARDTGTDVQATVNGISALGQGNNLSLHTPTLDLTTSVEAGFTGTSNFTITGGGALFQLGPDVVTAQQARIGIQSVSTARLGGITGRLYQLGSGGTAALGTDANSAATIADEAINAVTGLRGRLGAFQKTTLDSNLVSLNDTLANLTDAQSQIRDADFAAESARLTRAQILVQAGTAVLAIANSTPQSALSLLK